MSLLSDAFPDHFREQYVERNLQVGMVLRTYVTDTKPPKTKYFIIIGISQDRVALGVVYINSEINPNLFSKPELKQLHIPMSPDERELVEYDCFIDCSKIYEKPLESISQLLKENPSCDRGMLNSVELGRVQEKIYSASTISPRDKKKFGLV